MNAPTLRTALLLALAVAAPLSAQTRVRDVTSHEGDVPIRLVGYGLVVGLTGTGDRSFGSLSGAVHTVRSVTNLLRRFDIEVPEKNLRLRNVAAVMITAEISPFLRPGGRFDIQVASLGDATSLQGGVLWMSPLMMSPDGQPFATAQGTFAIGIEERPRMGYYSRKGTASGRISEGGVLVAPLPAVVTGGAAPHLSVRTPDFSLASRIADAINKVAGAGTARVEDPGSIALKPPTGGADSLPTFLASLDTIPVDVPAESRIVIDARNGVVASGGDLKVGNASVTLRGITVRIGDSTTTQTPGLMAMAKGATVRDVAAGLHAMGAIPSEVASVFDALRASGAVTAAVVIR